MRVSGKLLGRDVVDCRWIEEFLRDDGFGMIFHVLKDILAIEWRHFHSLRF